jgi:hypothetical protein
MVSVYCVVQRFHAILFCQHACRGRWHLGGDAFELGCLQRKDVLVIVTMSVFTHHRPLVPLCCCTIIPVQYGDVCVQHDYGIDEARVYFVTTVGCVSIDPVWIDIEQVSVSIPGHERLDGRKSCVVIVDEVSHALQRHLNVGAVVPRQDLTVPVLA